MNVKQERLARTYQGKSRGDRRSYKTELENAQVLLAWEAAYLSEGQASRMLNVDRVTLRMMRESTIAEGIKLADELLGERLRPCSMADGHRAEPTVQYGAYQQLSALIAHLRAEASFTKDRISGRLGPHSMSNEWVTHRLAYIGKLHLWALEVEELIAVACDCTTRISASGAQVTCCGSGQMRRAVREGSAFAASAPTTTPVSTEQMLRETTDDMNERLAAKFGSVPSSLSANEKKDAGKEQG